MFRVPKLTVTAASRDVLAANFERGSDSDGSAREEELDRLVARMKEEHLPQEDYEWYLDLRRYGSVPHGGFGLGVERTVCWICNLKHIREAIPYARMMGKFYP